MSTDLAAAVVEAVYQHGLWVVPAHTAPAAVLFPKDRWVIEAILADRPVENRNWYPGETIRDLARENFDHGVWE